MDKYIMFGVFGGYNKMNRFNIKKIPGVYKALTCYRKTRFFNPMKKADTIFYRRFGRYVDWDNPQDLNEKILWLKFHEDMNLWANYADKIMVRDYVKKKGLENIIIPIYGVWENTSQLRKSWQDLPERFALKSNNGSGNVILIKNKSKLQDKEVSKILGRIRKWILDKGYGLGSAELHYQFIDNKIYAEELLNNERNDISRSVIDYKIWCFNGKAFGILVVFDRNLYTGEYVLDFYDKAWERHSEYIACKKAAVELSRPQNLDEMVRIAELLSDGMPQVRIDLYDIDGRVYFGEMTLTSLGGYMDYFTPEALKQMGDQISLPASMKGNTFYNPKYVDKARIKRCNQESLRKL